MHLKRVMLHQKKFPTLQFYPFNLKIIQFIKQLEFSKPITFFIGENGTGKSTLLKAIAQRCSIHIWEQNERKRFKPNPYENKLHQAISIEWFSSRL